MLKNKTSLLIWSSVLAPFLFIIYFLITSYIASISVASPQYDVLISSVRNIPLQKARKEKLPSLVSYNLKIREGRLTVSADIDKRGHNYQELLLYRFNPETKKKIRIPVSFRQFKKKGALKWRLDVPELQKVKVLPFEKSPDGYLYMKSKSPPVLRGTKSLHVVQKKGRRINLPSNIGGDAYDFKFHGWIERNNGVSK